MFKLKYSPEDAPAQEFDFDVDNPLSLEAEALESVGGEFWDSYGDFLDRIGRGNARARRALLWVMLRRNDPKIRFSDVVFKLGEFVIDADDPEPEGNEQGGGEPTDSESPLPDTDQSPSN